LRSFRAKLPTTSFGGAVAVLGVALLLISAEACGSNDAAQPSPTGSSPSSLNEPASTPGAFSGTGPWIYTYQNPTPWPISYGSDSRFLAPNRDRVAICVEAIGVDDTLEGEARLSLEEALRVLAEHPIWVQFGFSPPEPQVVEGCPADPAYFETSGKARLRAVHVRSIIEPSYPSYYRIHTYVVPPEEIEKRDWHPGRVTTEEYSCSGDACAGVTTGVYVAPEALQDADLMEDLLKRAIGLEY